MSRARVSSSALTSSVAGFAAASAGTASIVAGSVGGAGMMALVSLDSLMVRSVFGLLTEVLDYAVHDRRTGKRDDGLDRGRDAESSKDRLVVADPRQATAEAMPLPGELL